MSEARARISADTSAFKSGLAEAKASMQSFSSETSASLGGAVAGFLAVEQVISRTFAAMEKYGDIGDLAERFNVSAETLQKFAFVAEQTGSSAETMARGLGKVKLSMAEAVQKGGDARTIFEAAGISMEQLKDGTVTVDEATLRLADVVAGTADETQKLAIVTAIYGAKLAGEMLPILDMGREKMEALGAQATKLSAEEVAALKQASDAWKAFKGGMDAGFATLAVGAVRFGAAIGFVADVLGILAARSMNMDFKGIGKDLEEAAIRAADRAYGAASEGKTPATGGQIIKTDDQKAKEKKDADDIESAKKRIADMERDAAIAAMDRAEKINALEREHVALLQQASELGFSTAEGYRKREEAAKVALELERERKAQGDEQARVTKSELDALSARDAAEHAAAMATMTDQQKLGRLRRDADAKWNAGLKKLDAGDTTGALKDETEAIRLNAQADALAKQMRGKVGAAPTVDSLQAVGGGGGVSASLADPQVRELQGIARKMDLLIEVTRSARAGSGGGLAD